MKKNGQKNIYTHLLLNGLGINFLSFSELQLGLRLMEASGELFDPPSSAYTLDPTPCYMTKLGTWLNQQKPENHLYLL
ncbi:MAG: hypothetical protein F6J93_03490 [Oscillatoria sp. SIO1A7]|nr:hypothetical protein [Oscillatoria sp. SIO1A7]